MFLRVPERFFLVLRERRAEFLSPKVSFESYGLVLLVGRSCNWTEEVCNTWERLQVRWERR